MVVMATLTIEQLATIKNATINHQQRSETGTRCGLLVV
jgi:hypothetical protein